MVLARSAFIFFALLAISCQFVRAAADDDNWDLDTWDDDEDHHHQHEEPKSKSQDNSPVAAAGAVPAPPSDVQQAPPMAAAQQSGGNFASYNESCVQPHQNTGKQCIISRGLTCIGGLCKCGPNQANPNIPLTYIDNRDVQNCEPIASERNRFACTWDQQCRDGKYGYFSRCSSGRCTCYDNGGRQTMEVENECFLVKSIGDTCENDVQCNVTIPGEAVCFGSRTVVGICQCSGGYFEYEWPLGSGKKRECLEVKTLDQACIADAQCRHNDGLGPLARCHDGRCACYDTENQFMKMNVSYYKPNPNPSRVKGKCYFLKGANETCTSNEECILGYHPLAVCLPHPSYNGEHVCQCSQDERRCNSGSGLFGSYVVTVILISIVGLVKQIS